MSISTPAAGLTRRTYGPVWRTAGLVGLFALAIVGAAVVPTARPAGADPATAIQDLTLFAGPGEEYGGLAYAPYGAALSVDGEAVNGYYPVSYDGVSGWVPTWAVAAEEYAAYEEPLSDEVVYDEEAVYDEAVVEEAASPVAAGGIEQIIYDAAASYGQPPADMLRVATCESNLDPGAINHGGNTYGLFQFLPSTWATTPYADQSYFDPYAAANAAAWMWSQGRRGEWVCQ
ncbi:MAG: hypothetical protein AVDCRST_MAG19-21 [uncultured Thermomicrobiales bacterium]|uniref:Transglycosylase SLT domain-containing protein n=1 Tax=uncultured Thermomicrobiales bacterium TaxID=1645740 RepID=A0A6J4U7M7_9BACT|nr:MAG: hypothetical protein AVDCRST_MAG19-21 [uncultured Thermomicrobiales bacterium]